MLVVDSGHGLRTLSGLLAAGPAFGGRLPALYGGDSREAFPAPVPYPAACSPQAWSAASGVALLTALLGLTPDAPGATLLVRPLRPLPVGEVTVRGLRFGGQELAVRVGPDGEVHVDAPDGVQVQTVRM